MIPKTTNAGMCRRLGRLVMVTIMFAVAQISAEEPLHENTSIINDSSNDPSFRTKIKTGEYRKIGSALGLIVDLFAASGTINSLPAQDNYIYKGKNKVMVDIVFSSVDIVDDSINQMDNEFEKQACHKNFCSGYASIVSLPQLSENNAIISIQPSIKPVTNCAGSICSQGDEAMQTDVARTSFGIDGTGMTIGVLSDSYNCLGGAAAGVASGDLPSDVMVLKEGPCPASDEGRAMMELIYDVAPNSKLAFYTAFESQADFANGIIALANAGCDVIVDDVGYAFVPYFMDGIIAQAANEVATRGVPFFSAAFNSGERIQSWLTDEGFKDSGFTLRSRPLHDFSQTEGVVDTVQNIQLRAGVSYLFVFQWDDPWAAATGGSVGAASDVDFFLVDGTNNVIEASENPNVGADSREFIQFRPSSSGVFGIAITLYSGPAPTHMSWQVFRGEPLSSVQHETISPTSYGHPNAAGAAGIAAAEFRDTPEFGVDPAVHESFTSRGGMPIVFDTTGLRLTDVEVRQQPRVTGPDGTSNTFFGTFNFFFGTSAAAPHVAAVAALMLSVGPDLTPSQIYSILEQTALDMDDLDLPGFQTGFDFRTGHGFVDGLAAITAAGNLMPVPAPALQPVPMPAPQPTPAPAPFPVSQPSGCWFWSNLFV